MQQPWIPAGLVTSNCVAIAKAPNQGWEATFYKPNQAKASHDLSRCIWLHSSCCTVLCQASTYSRVCLVLSSSVLDSKAYPENNPPSLWWVCRITPLSKFSASALCGSNMLLRFALTAVMLLWYQHWIDSCLQGPRLQWCEQQIWPCVSMKGQVYRRQCC